MCTVVFVRVLNRMLLDGQCCELLKSNELTKGPRMGRIVKTPMEVIRLAQLASPVASVVVWGWETGYRERVGGEMQILVGTVDV